ncbi:MAG: hypothetical protein EA411_12285, partial [Saprospirales bacterium]
MHVFSQVGHPDCDSDVPHFDVDLTGNPDSVYISPQVSREGVCCGQSHPDRCVSFTITLDEEAIGFIFDIYSGAEPSGALFYQIDCGPEEPVGEPICLPGGETYYITFCKPGANQNEYIIESVPGIIGSAPLNAQVNCDYSMSVSGNIDESTIVWQDITSGTGEYNSYLSCTTGCTEPEFTPAYSSPQFIEYEVCGQVSDQGGTCVFPDPICDTVLVQVIFLPDVTFFPDPPVFCEDGVEEVTAILSDEPSTYTYIWFDGPDATGNEIGSTNTILPEVSGTHSMILIDNFQSGCSRDTFNVDIQINTLPDLNLPPVEEICPGMEIEYDLPAGVDYEWIPETGVQSGSEDGSFILSPTITTEYIVNSTDQNGCSNQDTLLVEVYGCLECPPDLVACSIDDLPPYATISELLDAGGEVNYPCYISESGIELVDQISDGNSCPEELIRVYRVTDECGNYNTCEQTITLDDNSPPQIQCPDSIIVSCNIDEAPAFASFQEFIDAGGIATDNCQINELTFELVSEVSDELSCPETVERIYSIQDQCGNMDECSQIVFINDETPPEITCPQINPELCSVEDYPPYTSADQFLAAGGVLSDNCSVDYNTFNLLSDSVSGPPCSQSIVRFYQVSDYCGNTTTCEQQINIPEPQLPVFQNPPNDTIISCNYAVDFEFDFLHYSNEQELTCEIAGFAEGQLAGSFDECGGEQTITWTFTDDCDRTIEHVQTIIVEPAPAPEFIDTPSDETITCSEASDFVAAVTALSYTNNESDACEISGEVSPVIEENWDECGGTITITWEETVNCDHTLSHTQVITVEPAPAPDFVDAPSDETITCSEASDFVAAIG